MGPMVWYTTPDAMGRNVWAQTRLVVAKQLCQCEDPDLTICQSEPRHTLNQNCRSDRALTASYAACSTYPRYDYDCGTAGYESLEAQKKNEPQYLGTNVEGHARLPARPATHKTPKTSGSATQDKVMAIHWHVAYGRLVYNTNNSRRCCCHG
jgi:hypothetical protein